MVKYAYAGLCALFLIQSSMYCSATGPINTMQLNKLYSENEFYRSYIDSLKIYGHNPNSPEAQVTSALLASISADDPNALKIVLDAHPDIDANSVLTMVRRFLPVKKFKQLIQEHIDRILALLLEAGYDPNKKEPLLADQHWFPMHLQRALISNDLEALRAAIRAGADPNSIRKEPQLAQALRFNLAKAQLPILAHALTYRQFPMAKELAQSGAKMLSPFHRQILPHDVMDYYDRVIVPIIKSRAQTIQEMLKAVTRHPAKLIEKFEQ